MESDWKAQITQKHAENGFNHWLQSQKEKERQRKREYVSIMYRFDMIGNEKWNEVLDF